MCLKLTIYSELRRATKDIVCYKIMTLRRDEDKLILRSPFKKYLYTLNSIHKAKRSLHNMLTTLNGDFFHINIGIHSFTKLNDAIYEVGDGTWYNIGGTAVIVECVIPKYSFYVEGIWEQFDSIISTAIIPKAIIEYI